MVILNLGMGLLVAFLFIFLTVILVQQVRGVIKPPSEPEDEEEED